MASCVLTARLSMKADIVKSIYLSDNVTNDSLAPALPPDNTIGYWDYAQDPDSGAIEKVWVGNIIPDDPATPLIDESTRDYVLAATPCEVRGVMEGGIRVAGTTQRFSEIYENVEWANATFGKSVDITKTDRITNIRNSKGLLIWRNEENTGFGQAGGATTFNVMGVTPVLDPFGNLIEQKVLLQRAGVQNA